jgi:exopolyphosphatase/guanosine-5'-triphosphate,3'-diphosphate pyrophosphatase
LGFWEPSKVPSDEIVPRWEWRSFAPDFGDAGRTLAAEATAVVESDEVYLLSAADDSLVKLRGGLLDIKRLQQVDDHGLEQWVPTLKAPISIAPAEIDEVTTALGVVRVDVHKTRHRSTIDGCLAELTEVRAGGASAWSIAIESEDPGRVLALLGRLGLADRPNTNYARGLAAMVGFGVRRSAVIDVGTNSVKFIVGERREPGDWDTVVDRAEVTRLGEGLSAGGPIGPEPMRRTVDAIAGMADEAKQLGVQDIVAVGTAGLRMASNADDVVVAVRERCGVDLQVISGEEEARLAVRAATVGLPVAGSLVVFDTGGGSSQFTFGHGTAVEEQFSVPVGAVRFTELFGLAGAVSAEVLAQALAAIAADLDRLDDRVPPELLVGMGGALTNLAAVSHGLTDYHPDVVHGTVLARAEIDRQIELYRTSSTEQRRTVVGLQPARAEVILAGACIVRTVLDKVGVEELRVSDRGLRHGVLADLT